MDNIKELFRDGEISYQIMQACHTEAVCKLVCDVFT